MRDIISPLDGLRSPFGARRGTIFSPLSLFASGEPGGWYDPSDLTTLFQDSAGTTPVTAVEQPVGLMLDKSGRGNHLTQSTSTARPVLSARVNLLTYTEQFDNAAWTKSGANPSTVTANTTVAPNGTTTADTITNNSVPTGEIVYQAVSAPLAPLRFIQQFKRGNHDWVRITVTDAATRTNAFGAWFNLATGAVGTSQVSGTGTLTSKSATSLGDGWYLCELIGSVPDASLWVLNASADADNSFTRVANGTRIVWGADLRVANDTAAPAYQRVGVGTPGSSTAAGSSDYTVTGFPLYLRFDGTDDAMASASVNFTSTDAMSVFGGIRKLSQSTNNIVAELSANINTNNGAFTYYIPSTSGLGYLSKGTVEAANTPSTGFTAPVTLVMTGVSKISTDVNLLRANGVQIGSVVTDQGAGNFGNYPLYIGARGGTTLPFTGRLYQLIVRGAATSDTQIAQTESYVSTQMGGGYVPVGYDFLVDANGDQLTDASGNALYTIPLYS